MASGTSPILSASVSAALVMVRRRSSRARLDLLALAQHADELAVLARALVEPLQRAERGGVGLVVGEARAPRGDGLLRVLEHRLVEAADALVELAAPRRVLLERAPRCRGRPAELLVAGAGGVDAAERLRGRDRRGPGSSGSISMTRL